MRQIKDKLWPTVIAGFGSPHGDDQAGWHLASLLRRHPDLPARVVKVREGTQLLADLPRCKRLIIVDACRSGGEVGSMTRLRWPDRRIACRHSQSTHGVSIWDALALAERLGQLPPAVDIYGIEIGESLPASDLSPAVLQAVAQLEAALYDELCGARCEVAHA